MLITHGGRFARVSPSAQLPAILDSAMLKYDAMLQALLAYRTAYLYELPRDGDPAAGGVVCAVIAEVARRFGPHLNAWRSSRTITL